MGLGDVVRGPTRDESERISKALHQEGVFSGGGYEDFHEAGENQLEILLHFGMERSSKVLDVGCGCLRGGRWVIPYLDANCYFGIEPNESMVDAGRRIVVGEQTLMEKSPTLDTNSDFDFGVFETDFDFVIARSVWTHASKNHIETMLDQFVHHSKPSAIFLTSMLKPRIPFFDDYRGEDWVGRSHDSDLPGIARHSIRWINKVCKKRGLKATRITEIDLNYRAQVWFKVDRA
ncbi:MAG TPA: class I SAM-dependent methyltransferase [Candidatus Thalassarchaeaceae archaeon]|nr:class I SAM-dependent methyltransferase [Candidatus Thalassarchaeaceae archaeon]